MGIQFPRLFYAMLQQIQHCYAAAGAHNAPGLPHGLDGMQGVMQALVEERNIHFAIADGKRFEIAQAVIEVRNSKAGSQARLSLFDWRGISELKL